MADRFENKGALAATIVVAASDSLNQAAANYVCDGVNDEVEIQAALDALPATGGEVFLLDGTYNCEVTINLESNQTLRGCGRNTILTTSTTNLVFLHAVGGSSTEKVGITIADLQIDGNIVGSIGIYFQYVDYSIIHHVLSGRHQRDWLAGIRLEHSDFNTISECTCYDNSEGIWLYESTYNNVINNICYGNTDVGVYFESDSHNNTAMGNICYGNNYGLETGASDRNNIVFNTCQSNNLHGIWIGYGDHNQIIGNVVIENSQSATNASDDINLSHANYNNIQGNLCRAGALAAVPRYGINIGDVGCAGNLVIGNDLYDDGFGTAPFNDAGTGTKLSVAAFRFTEAVTGEVVTTSPIGVDVDAVGEEALTWGQLPLEVQQVVRIKIWAVSTGTPLGAGGQMHLEITFNAGASGEAYNLVANSWNSTDFNGEEADYGVDDVIHWVIEDGDVGNKLLNLLGGDSFELKAIGEGGADPDGATDAVFRVVEIEYV